MHLHPHLVRCWMRRGRQRQVKAPGKNQKVTVFGAIGYGRGLFVHHTQPRKTAWGVRMILQKLVSRARRTGRTIVLVMDRGNPHHAKAIERDLELAKPHLAVFWLPHYCPELNLIERLWKHLKGSRIANVLFAKFRQFQDQVERALSEFAHDPDLTLSTVASGQRQIIRRKIVGGT